MIAIKFSFVEKLLLTEAKDRNIPLPENASSVLPSKLVEISFSKTIGE